MRSLVAVLAVLALGACSSDNVTSTVWKMRPCDQARVDLAVAMGRAPDAVEKDATDPRAQRTEVDLYYTLTLQTKTTDAYSFDWTSGRCVQAHTTTTVPR